MRIACLGGGPAGLYFAISMKLRDPAHDIDLFERNRADDTFGWGVVFSDQTVDNLSTFIVEMAPDTWTALGLDRMEQPEAISLCERIFAEYLDGHALMSNAL